MTALDGMSAGWSPHPETEYILRFDQEPEIPTPGAECLPPPLTPDQVAAAEAAQAEEDRSTTVRMYSALVQAAINGALSSKALEAGVIPKPGQVQAHAGMTLRQLGREKFAELFSEVPMERLVAAAERGEEIVPVPPPRSPKRRSTAEGNSYQRLMGIYSDLSEWQGLVNEAYFPWSSVCAYYQEPVTHAPLTLTSNSHRPRWGRYYTKDLMEYPSGSRGETFERSERQLLENRFLDLRGIPYLDRPEDLEETLAALPPGTPALCFVDNTKVVSLRSSEALHPSALEPEQWDREAVMLANLIMLRSLRSAGRSVGRTWMQAATGYTDAKMNTNLDFLVDEVGLVSGAIICMSGSRRRRQRAENPHFSMAQNALILDARPDAAAAHSELTV